MSRYTTALFGEVTRLGARMTAGRTPGEVTIQLIDPITDTAIPLSSNVCTELTTSTRGGFSLYVWPTSNIVTPATVQTEYWYIITDTVTGYFREGKFVLGGFPDESARARYGDQIHVSPAPEGNPLTPLGTVGPETITFATGTPDSMSRTTPWPAAFAVGRRIQISGTANNDGVTTEIVSRTGSGPYLLNFAASNGLLHGAFTAGAAASTTVVVKSQIYGNAEGTDQNPVDNIRDARQMCADLGFRRYHLHGGVNLDIDFPHDFWNFFGSDQDLDILNFVAGSSNDGSNFSKLWITGNLNGRIIADNCIIGSGSLSGLKGTLTTCALKDTIVLGGDILGDHCASRSSVTTIIDNTGNHSFLMGSVQGVFTIVNMTGGTVGVNIQGSILQLGGSVTGGIITAIGSGEFIYTKPLPVGLTVNDYVARGSQIRGIASSSLSRGVIDITTTPWRENRYEFNTASGGNDNAMTVLHRYDLYDQDGVAIAGNHLSGNNPLFDPTRLIAERRRVT